MSVNLALILIILALSAAVFLLAARLVRIKKQLRCFEAALGDVAAGNGARRMIAREGEETAGPAFAMNGIIAHYEEELNALRRAQEANRQLMTSLSHDVRTPLTTLIGYLDAARRADEGPERRETHVAAACRKAHELKTYIDALFDWFKLGSGEYALHMQTVELAELTRALLADWVPVLEEQGMRYAVDIPERRIMARIDPDGYARIVGNLLSNVLAHSGAQTLRVSLACEERRVCLCVEDDGVGIGKEDLARIFDRLYKCDKARSAGGSGLGLSIALGIAGEMGGTLEAQSEPGRGTAFMLSFPQTQG